MADFDLDAAAARLLVRESRREPPRSRIALHNGRFLRATLESTERHNERLAGGGAFVGRKRPPAPPPSDDDEEEKPRRVEVVLQDFDRDAGIIFERSEGGRPIVRGLTASARPDVQRSVGPGMVLSKIAGVKCKAIEYAAALDLVRSLERPLKLTFKRQDEPKKKRKRP